MTIPESADAPTLGMLMLTTRPVHLPGAMSNPAAHPYPVRFLEVPGAQTEVVVGDDAQIVGAYIDGARQLEREGVAAITSNCGFTARFQPQVASAVSVPVALSSLLLVPWVARTIPPGTKVGVVTFDAERLAERHYNGAGWSAEDTPVAMVGIEGSETWRELSKPVPEPDPSVLERDVLDAAQGLLGADPTVRALVLECSAFPAAAPAVRAATGLPVYHFVTLASLLMASIGPGPALALAAA